MLERLLFLPVLFVPMLAELFIESHYELKKGISLNHPWTMVARGLLMTLIALIPVDWAQLWPIDWARFGAALALQIGIHFMFFNYFYNWRTGRKTFYLRDAGIDKILKEVTIIGMVFFQLMGLLIGIVLYFPEINERGPL